MTKYGNGQPVFAAEYEPITPLPAGVEGAYLGYTGTSPAAVGQTFVQIGKGYNFSGAGPVSIGNGLGFAGVVTNAVNIGVNNDFIGNGSSSVVIGNEASAAATNATAIGTNAIAGSGSIAIGKDAVAGIGSVVLGSVTAGNAGFFVDSAKIRSLTAANALYYDTGNGEITYGSLPQGTPATYTSLGSQLVAGPLSLTPVTLNSGSLYTIVLKVNNPPTGAAWNGTTDALSLIATGSTTPLTTSLDQVVLPGDLNVAVSTSFPSEFPLTFSANNASGTGTYDLTIVVTGINIVTGSPSTYTGNVNVEVLLLKWAGA
jgi:hypothetical protein